MTRDSGGRGSRLWRIVTGASANHQLGVAAGQEGLHADIAEGGVLFGVGRVVGERVLVANVVGDLTAGALDLVE